jgi:hypothetical protein
MAHLRNKLKEVNESADELDGYTSDDAPMSQKIPDSQVKMNTELFGANHANGQAPSADQSTGISLSTNSDFFKVVSFPPSERGLEPNTRSPVLFHTQAMILV